MTLTDLLTECSRVLQDTNNTYWSTTELTQYLNEAQLDFCRRTKVLTDTVALNRDASVSPNGAFYTVPSDVIELQKVLFSGKALPKTDSETLGLLVTSWDSNTANTPTAYIFGEYGPTLLRIYPYKSAASVDVKATYAKTPTTLSSGSDVPKIPAEHHLTLTYWAIYRAYLKDSDARNPDKAAAFKSLYNEAVSQMTGVNNGPANAS